MNLCEQLNTISESDAPAWSHDDTHETSSAKYKLKSLGHPDTKPVKHGDFVHVNKSGKGHMFHHYLGAHPIDKDYHFVSTKYHPGAPENRVHVAHKNDIFKLHTTMKSRD